MKRYGTFAAAWLAALTIGLAACGDSDTTGGDTGSVAQQITVKVESVGESLMNPATSKADAHRPRPSIGPSQDFDKLALVIIDSESTQVVYKTELDNWSATDNTVSNPYIEGNVRGRKAQLTLPEGSLLADGKDYIIYAVGYPSQAYGNYVPFAGTEAGDLLNTTEVVNLPQGELPDEVFAGAEMLHVRDGKVLTQPSSDAALEDAVITLRRQVAGTFGYFTRIQATYVQNGLRRTAKYLRLVSSRANRSIILGGFRSMEDPENFNQENVINGYQARTDYDASLAGTDTPNAFVLYQIDLARWFPGTEGSDGLPLDKNGDNYLDEKDDNWQMDTETYPDNIIKLQAGTVFGDRFLIASAMYEADIESGLPTFQLQVTDEDGRILQYWDVLLREQNMLHATRTIVSLSEDGTRTVITTETNPETEYCYSIVRNHLYAMGDKAHSQSYGEDEPIALANARELVVDVDNEWEAAGTIIFH